VPTKTLRHFVLREPREGPEERRENMTRRRYKKLSGELKDAIDAIREYGMADNHDGVFICTDVNGVQHDLSPSGYYITSESEGLLHRIHANYPPDEIAEIGFDEVHRHRGLDPIPIEFLVDEAEHARMVRDGVLDDVDGQNVVKALMERASALLRGERGS
jgi:hypothetical protein